MCSALKGSSAVSCSTKLLTPAGSWQWARRTIGPLQEMCPNCQRMTGMLCTLQAASGSAECQVLFRALTRGHSPEAVFAFASLQPNAGTAELCLACLPSHHHHHHYYRPACAPGWLWSAGNPGEGKVQDTVKSECFQANCPVLDPATYRPPPPFWIRLLSIVLRTRSGSTCVG